MIQCDMWKGMEMKPSLSPVDSGWHVTCERYWKWSCHLYQWTVSGMLDFTRDNAWQVKNVLSLILVLIWIISYFKTIAREQLTVIIWEESKNSLSYDHSRYRQLTIGTGNTKGENARITRITPKKAICSSNFHGCTMIWADDRLRQNDLSVFIKKI